MTLTSVRSMLQPRASPMAHRGQCMSAQVRNGHTTLSLHKQSSTPIYNVKHRRTRLSANTRRHRISARHELQLKLDRSAMILPRDELLSLPLLIYELNVFVN